MSKKGYNMNLLAIFLLHLGPLLLLSIPVILLVRGTKKAFKNPPPTEPDITELEKKLNKLIEKNHQYNKMANLKDELKNSSSNTISGYIKMDKKDLKGFHLFQLIFNLIKNKTEDTKILKILHKYLPSCSNAHLYAMLNSFKVFLNISHKDGVQKVLLKDLNNNKVHSTLLYLERKLNQTLSETASVPPAMQTLLINQAVVYGLIFASFSEFYTPKATEKILRLTSQLSPELFKYWHQIPKIITSNYIERPKKLPYSNQNH